MSAVLFDRRALASLPNLLTCFRILLIPVLVLLLTRAGERFSLIAGLTFFVACISDFLDGYLARRQGIVTPLGKLLDPVADKLIVTAVLVMLAAMPDDPRVPAWMVVVIVGRELAVTVLRAIAYSEGIVLEAEELGKYKMIFQMFALQGLVLHYPFAGINFHAAGMYFLWLSLVVSLWSGIDYHVKFFRQTARGRA